MHPEIYNPFFCFHMWTGRLWQVIRNDFAVDEIILTKCLGENGFGWAAFGSLVKIWKNLSLLKRSWMSSGVDFVTRQAASSFRIGSQARLCRASSEVAMNSECSVRALLPPQSFLYSINQTICLRLDSIEAKLLALEATCKSLEEKLDLVMNKQHSPIQVPMVAGSPLGATQTCNKVRW